jgi:hypothetical protein
VSKAKIVFSALRALTNQGGFVSASLIIVEIVQWATTFELA